MKKILFLLAMLPMMIFTACSSDEGGDESTLSVISDGTWYISNYGEDDYLNTREKDTNWVSIDHKSGIIDYHMQPNLGSAILAWNAEFRVSGNKIIIEDEYDTESFEFIEVNKNTAIAKFRYTIINPIEFSIYLRKQ